MARVELAENEPDGRHVLETVVAIGEIVQRSALVDHENAGLVRPQLDALDLVQAVLDLRMEPDRRFDRGLRVQCRRIRDLEEHVLDDEAFERPREYERSPAE